MPYKSVQEIPVYIKAHSLVLEIYTITSKFPKSEMFGVVSQLRRSSASVPANITEGFYRHTTKELIQFLYNARGSLGETVYHLTLSKDLEYITEDQYNKLKLSYDEVGKQLNGWIKNLRNRINS